jgi:hypothetical protein
MTSTQSQRIVANCKLIWGKDDDYDLDIETDDWVTYTCYVKRIVEGVPGPLLMLAMASPSREAAWAELDRMLELQAKVVKRGTPMTKEERLEISGGPRGEYKALLSEVMEHAPSGDVESTS